MKPAQPFDRDDAAAPEEGPRSGVHRIRPAGGFQPHPRSARRAGNRLRVEAPVGGIGIFRRAVVAEAERRIVVFARSYGIA